MSIQVRRVDPFEWREAIVNFFWKLKIWPQTTKDEYFRSWDWRYASIPESVPAVWLAVDGREIVGHIAVNFRRLSFEGRAVRAGVPGNFRVDPSHQRAMTGAALAAAPRAMVQSGEIDILLGYANRIAHSMLIRLGMRDLGAMRPYVDVCQWGPVLARRVVGGAMLAPLARLAPRVRGATRRRKLNTSTSEFVARSFSLAEVVSMDRSHWASSKSLVSNGSAEYFANRFLRSPFRSYHTFGIVARDTARLEGLVVAEGTGNVNILECTVNEDALSEVRAVDLAIQAIPTTESVTVALLPGTTLVEDFVAGAYFPRAMEDANKTTRNTWWSAYWQATHPLATCFADMNRWKLWYAWSHH